ncbi:MAG TPA: transglycosylase SLT domain-containing protein [Ideonella sp.]|nr:transglycosylase SLT domain-containing protein [Ideonella sp.]
MSSPRPTPPPAHAWAWLLAACLLPLAAAAQDTGTEHARIAELRMDAAAYERGGEVPRDGVQAAALYCEAARLGDAASQFDLGEMYAYGRGVPRNDGLAAFFFRLAAEQGVQQATNLMRLMGEPAAELPACMRDPAPPPAPGLAPAQPLPYQPPPSAPAPIVELVRQVAPEYQVSAPLVFAIMHAESNFNYTAVSPKNAQGLMQLIPETAQRFRVRNAFDPAQNVRGGMAYLRWLLAYFEGDVSLVAAAYNAGERAVERYLGVPPYDETRAYVRRIVAAVGRGAQPFDASVAEPSPQLARIRALQRPR